MGNDFYVAVYKSNNKILQFQSSASVSNRLSSSIAFLQIVIWGRRSGEGGAPVEGAVGYGFGYVAGQDGGGG